MTAVLRVLEIIVRIIFPHLSVGVMTRAREMEGDALLSLRWRMCQIREDFGHMSRQPENLWPIFSLLTTFF